MGAKLGSSEQVARKVAVKRVGGQRQQQAGRGYDWLEHPTLALASLLRLGPRVVAAGFGGRCILAGVVAFRGPRPNTEQLKRVVHGVVRRFGFLVRLVC